MATIQRPVKEGSVRTYQQKVGLGFVDILASEMDADLDTIYAAWNGGADTINLIDGSVTTPKLASAPNGVSTTKLNDLAVTLAKLAVGASIRQLISGGIPVAFYTSSTTPVDVVAPSITSQGGCIVLIASGGWGAKNPANTDQFAEFIVMRDSTTILAWRYPMNAGSTTLATFPLPPIIALDQPVAGLHTYHFQVDVSATGCSFFTGPANRSGYYWLVELA
jgi:hypothetical protein